MVEHLKAKVDKEVRKDANGKSTFCTDLRKIPTITVISLSKGFASSTLNPSSSH